MPQPASSSEQEVIWLTVPKAGKSELTGWHQPRAFHVVMMQLKTPTGKMESHRARFFFYKQATPAVIKLPPDNGPVHS